VRIVRIQDERYTALVSYAVLGVTGNTGGATARALLRDGKGVRAIVRHESAGRAWSELGADVAIADLRDPQALSEAFCGVDGVFVATPPVLDVADPFAANRGFIASLRAAILAVHIPLVVYVSSIGAQHSSGLGAIRKLHDLERTFDSLPIPSIALRAGWFMENHRSQFDVARNTGILTSMLDPLDLQVPMIATVDIGQAAAKLLQSRPSTRTRVVELSFEKPYSSADVALAMSAIIGRSVKPRIVPCAERIDVYRSWGVSAVAASAMSEMIDGFNSGWIAFEGGRVERMFGKTSLEEALATFAEAPSVGAP
jgi:NAD(P)H dehydrogenase (quinone)